MLLSLSACKEDSQSILFVRQVQADVPPTCTVDNTPDSLQLEGGQLDVALRTTYEAVLLVGNQVNTRGSADLVRTETSKVQLTEAEVHIQDATGAEVSAYTLPINGFVDEATGNVPGYGNAEVTLIDSTTSNIVLADGKPRRFFAEVVVRGHTLGGSDVASGTFGFPIDLCKGCLIDFPSDSVDTDLVTPNGPSNCKSTTGTVKDAQCLIGQDDRVDCRQCQGNPVCTP